MQVRQSLATQTAHRIKRPRLNRNGMNVTVSESLMGKNIGFNFLKLWQGSRESRWKTVKELSETESDWARSVGRLDKLAFHF